MNLSVLTTTGAAAGGNMSSMLIMLLVYGAIIAAMYFIFFRPQNKKYNPHICIQHNAYRNIENCIERAKHKA
ncbi:hypothetical protein, partial [Hominenteromicrobium sp.]|uniref:hypothetical protein n=1 Tax=Hominenteromicrobium sp. TaxID=3073581 RepID=UPI003A901F13